MNQFIFRKNNSFVTEFKATEDKSFFNERIFENS